jgi:hypothetical protein
MPVTDHGGPYGCETLRVPHYLDYRLTDGGKVVSLTRLERGRKTKYPELTGSKHYEI